MGFVVACAAGASAQPALSAQAPVHPLTQGVFAYYPFNLSPEDQSPNHWHPQATPQVVYRYGVFGHAAVFARPGARVQMPEKQPEPPKEFSIAAWVHLSDQEAAPNLGIHGQIAGNLKVIRTTRRLHFTLEYELLPGPGSSEKPKREVRALSSQRALALGAWQHVATVYSSDGFLSMYVNGEQDARFRLPNWQRIRLQYPFTRPIGGEELADPRDYTLHGKLDELLLYNRPLKPAEVKLLARPPEPRLTRSSLDCGGRGQKPCKTCIAYDTWSFVEDTCKEFQESCLRGYRPVGGLCQEPPGTRRIEVTPLPKVITLPPGACKTPLESNLEGYVAKVTNAETFEYVVPDSRKFATSRERIIRYAEFALSKRDISTWSRLKDIHGSPPCSELKLTDASKKAPFEYALWPLDKWADRYRANLAVNANWFHIDLLSGITKFPYSSPCTQIFGYSAIDGDVVSPADRPDLSLPAEPNLLDAFLVIQERQADGSSRQVLKIVSNSEIPSDSKNVAAAVGGFILMRNGKLQTPASSTKLTNGARTGLGLSADRKTLYAVVIQGGPKAKGMNTCQLAMYMHQLGAADVLNLDNSGSSQFYFAEDFDAAGEVIKSKPGDLDMADKPAYRPIPNFLGIKY